MKTNEAYEDTIQELQPYTNYSLCIKARIFNDSGFWSESACEKTETEESGVLRCSAQFLRCFHV